jgi:hypothetical protein
MWSERETRPLKSWAVQLSLRMPVAIAVGVSRFSRPPLEHRRPRPTSRGRHLLGFAPCFDAMRRMRPAVLGFGTIAVVKPRLTRRVGILERFLNELA